MEKNVTVTKEFVEIYKNFNVIDQTEKMKSLSKKELLLLLTVALDKFSDTDPVVKCNFLPFKDEVMDIFHIQDDCESTNSHILELIEITGDKYIETDNIVDEVGNKLPEPLTKEEIRDAKIKLINK